MLSKIKLGKNVVRNFSVNFSESKAFKFNSEIKSEILKKKSFAPFLSKLSYPIELGRNLSKDLRSDYFFSRSMYYKVFAAEETLKWTMLIKLFYKALYEQDFAFFEKNVEKNLQNRIEQFYRELNGAGMVLNVTEPEEATFNVSFVGSKVFQGVFIERQLNYGINDYMVKKTMGKEIYELNTNKKNSLRNIDYSQVKFLDPAQNEKYIEKDRKSYKVNQYIMELQTDIKFYLATKNPDEIVYGAAKPSYETHHFVIENRRDYLEATPYFITDVDFALNRNPHVKAVSF